MDYQNGKIYTIRSHQTDDFYIGSTCQPLYKRLSGHKRSYKHWLINSKNLISSYEIIKFDDCYIELLELCSCSSKEELLKKEGELIRLHKCVNKCIVGRTLKEYRQENKEIISIKDKERRLKNIEKIKERDSLKITCECGSIYRKSHKSRHLKTKKHITFIN